LSFVGTGGWIHVKNLIFGYDKEGFISSIDAMKSSKCVFLPELATITSKYITLSRVKTVALLSNRNFE
jgi:hypothetical protein